MSQMHNSRPRSALNKAALFIAAALLAGCSSSVSSVLSPSARISGANLYVANYSDNSVTVYAPGSSKVLRAISQGVKGPDALAFDGSGNLYVANAGGNNAATWVTVYAPGSTSPSRRISRRSIPVALAFDAFGNLYVAGGRSVTVYGAGSNKVLRTISGGLRSPDALAFDSLYVANLTGNVTVYAAGSNKLLRTIPDSGTQPWALAFDATGNLYVVNIGSVTIYAPGRTTMLRKISQGVKYPTALAFDGSGSLYLANSGRFLFGKTLRSTPRDVRPCSGQSPRV
jgi:DNA-binding beta-propeller fold protein YncE